MTSSSTSSTAREVDPSGPGGYPLPRSLGDDITIYAQIGDVSEGGEAGLGFDGPTPGASEALRGLLSSLRRARSQA
jgi:hypothetical protein